MGGGLLGKIAFHIDRIGEHGEDEHAHQGLLTGDLDVEGACRPGCFTLHRGRYGHHVRIAIEPAGNAGADVGIDRAHGPQRRAHLEADALARADGVHVAGHERKLAAADAEERMSPTIDALAFDVRDRADGRHVVIARDQRDGQGAARLQGHVAFLFAEAAAADGPALHRNHAELTQTIAQETHASLRHAADSERGPQRHHPQPVRRPGLRIGEIVRDRHRVVASAIDRQRPGQPDASRRSPLDCGMSRVGWGPLLLGQVAQFVGGDVAFHLGKWRDAGERLLAIGPGEGDGPEQFPLNVDRAAAHAGDDARVLEIQSREPAQDHVPSRTGVAQDAEHLGLECFDLRSLDDGAPFPFHARTHVIDVPVGAGIGRSFRRALNAGEAHQQGQSQTKDAQAQTRNP